MEKAFGYIRVSTDKQEKEGISLDNQREKVAQYCILNDLHLVATFSDTLSGKNLNREAFQEMMARIGEVEHIVIYKLDRLGRKTVDLLTLIEGFDKSGIGLHSVMEKLDTKSSIGRFVMRTLSSLSELERDNIRDRTRDAMRKVREIKPIGGVGFGEVACFEDNKRVSLKVNEEEAKILAEIMVLKEKGFNLRQIKEVLESKGVKTKRGCTEWRESVLYRIIKRNQREHCLVH